MSVVRNFLATSLFLALAGCSANAAPSNTDKVASFFLGAKSGTVNIANMMSVETTYKDGVATRVITMPDGSRNSIENRVRELADCFFEVSYIGMEPADVVVKIDFRRVDALTYTVSSPPGAPAGVTVTTMAIKHSGAFEPELPFSTVTIFSVDSAESLNAQASEFIQGCKA